MKDVLRPFSLSRQPASAIGSSTIATCLAETVNVPLVFQR
jgi:hypothetical protein